jgi:hypothetical protein
LCLCNQRRHRASSQNPFVHLENSRVCGDFSPPSSLPESEIAMLPALRKRHPGGATGIFIGSALL